MPPHRLSRRLPVNLALHPVSVGRHRLPAVFGTAQLVILGLGVMIGAGIFSLSGTQAASNAGPAVIISFLIAAAVCLLAALCYAELSSTIPVAGSVYTFSYVAFGELWGWLVGWALVLELLVAAGVVARAWSAYAVATVDGFGLDVPASVADHARFDGGLNIVAPLVLLVLGVLVVTGTRLSARVLTIAVLGKVAVIVLVVAVGSRYVEASHYTPFIPDPQPAPEAGSVLQTILGGSGTAFGLFGVFAAASVITFAYIGFDLIATAAEDTRDPRHSLPRAMLIGLALVTVLYVAMATVLVGLRPYTELGTEAPVSDALASVGADWAVSVVNLGGLLAFTTVIMVVLIGQSRVLFAMGRDGLLPSPLGRVSRAFTAPSRAAAVATVVAMVLALYPGLGSLEEMLVLGALFAFFFCTVGVLVLRWREPRLERGFRVRLVPFVPALGALLTIWLGLNLTLETWRNFLVWMLVGLAIYLGFGRRNSVLARTQSSREGPDEAPWDEPGRHAR